MEKDLDFRKEDWVYCRYNNIEGTISEITEKYIEVSFAKFKGNVFYELDGSLADSTEQMLFHDPERILNRSIDEYIKSISKPPKRLVKRYANMSNRSLYVLYNTKKEAEQQAANATFEYLLVAVELEIDEKLL